MNDPRDISKQRIQLIQELEKQLSVRIERIQNALYSSLVEKLTDLRTDGNNIQYSAGNFGVVNSILRRLTKESEGRRLAIVRWVIQQVRKIFRINTKQFATSREIDNEVRRLVMSRLGYDIRTQKILNGGFLQRATSVQNITTRVGSLMNQAISAKMPLQVFRRSFRRAFVNPDGLGILQQHYESVTRDLFQEIDRTTQQVYADKLELNYAVYSGTIKDNTRPFCKARIDKVYSREEIGNWRNLEFQGKPKVYDPFIHCGGYNCRHHLSWISDELAEKLRA